MLANDNLVTSLRTRAHPVGIAGSIVPVHSWEQPAVSGIASQDASLVTTFAPAPWNDYLHVMRIVVTDGVTPVAGTAAMLGVDDPAVFAAHTVTRAFTRPTPLEECAVFANEFLAQVTRFSCANLTRRERPQAVVRAVDVCMHANGAIERIDVLNAGDCTSHMLFGSQWVDPIVEQGFAAHSVARWNNWYRAHPTASLELTQQMEDVFFATPEDFDSTPIGAFAHPNDVKFTLVSLRGNLPAHIDDLGLVVASDGVRAPSSMSPARYFEHLRRSGHRAHAEHHVKPSDDVTVVAVGNLAPDLNIRHVTSVESTAA